METASQRKWRLIREHQEAKEKQRKTAEKTKRAELRAARKIEADGRRERRYHDVLTSDHYADQDDYE